jgi:hypothetical protein
MQQPPLRTIDTEAIVLLPPQMVKTNKKPSTRVDHKSLPTKIQKTFHMIDIRGIRRLLKTFHTTGTGMTALPPLLMGRTKDPQDGEAMIHGIDISRPHLSAIEEWIHLTATIEVALRWIRLTATIEVALRWIHLTATIEVVLRWIRLTATIQTGLRALVVRNRLCSFPATT